MKNIELNNGYYIEIDTLNYTLKQRYVNKKGKETSRIVGYFGNMRHLIYAYLEQCQIQFESREGIQMIEYVKMVKESNKRAVSGLYDVLDRFPIK